MRIQLAVRSYNQMLGLARYTKSLCRPLSAAGVDHSLAFPAQPLSVRVAHHMFSSLGLDVRTFFATCLLSWTGTGSMIMVTSAFIVGGPTRSIGDKVHACRSHRLRP